jgi:uncharacterized membrane protein YvlD (DUF360 family)
VARVGSFLPIEDTPARAGESRSDGARLRASQLGREHRCAARDRRDLRQVEIERWGPLLLGAAVLGLANAFVKPVLAILTLPVILLTFGLGYFALNVAMLALAEWIAPDFSIDGFWTYVGATIIVSLVNWILDALLPDAG